MCVDIEPLAPVSNIDLGVRADPSRMLSFKRMDPFLI